MSLIKVRQAGVVLPAATSSRMSVEDDVKQGLYDCSIRFLFRFGECRFLVSFWVYKEYKPYFMSNGMA